MIKIEERVGNNERGKEKLSTKKSSGGGVPIKTLANKKWFVILIAILIVGVIGLGLTYAYWTLSFTQENSNFVTSDCFHITFDGKNDINLQNAYPMSDDELYDFYESATPYHFVIENTCDAEATAIINLETISHDNKLADEYIETILYNGEKNYSEIIKNNTESKDIYSRKKLKRKYTNTEGEVNFYNYQLTNNPINQNKVIEEALTAYKLYEFKFNGKGKREFNLLQYMYQETPANENTINKAFESKITVTTAYKPTIPTNTLAARKCGVTTSCTDETRVFQPDYIENTTKIVFQNRMKAPEKYVAEFDESAGRDGSVKAYVVQNEDNTTYTIYFQTNGNFEMTNGTNYFRSFSKVEEVKGLEYLDTSKVTSMNYMFNGMGSLANLDLSSFDTSNVTSMSAMFWGMSNLSSLDVSPFNTSKVRDMSYMFSDLKNLVELDISNLDTSEVTNMNYLFYGSSKLTELDLRTIDTSKVISMSSMFSGMNSLTSIDLSPLDTSQVTNMGSMFSNMSSLTNLDLSPLNTGKAINMNSIFANMSSLTSINLSSFDTSNVEDMSWMFQGCRSLKSIDVSSFNTSKVEKMNSMFRNTALKELDVSHFDTSKVIDMSSMFYGMSGLTSLDLSSFDTSNVTAMNSMFYNCLGLTSLDLSSFDTSNVTTMNSMFNHTPNLKQITYSDSFTRKEGSEIGNMFYNCPANKPTHESWDGAFAS